MKIIKKPSMLTSLKLCSQYSEYEFKNQFP